MFHDVHRLARAYHWSRREILSLSIPCRTRHLLFIEAEGDAALLEALGGALE